MYTSHSVIGNNAKTANKTGITLTGTQMGSAVLLKFAMLVAAVVLGAGSARADWRIIDHPNAVETHPRGVSGRTVVGNYTPTVGKEHGFVYDGTKWTDLDYPGARYTLPSGISGNKIVGNYYADPQAQFWHSFVYDGTTWTRLDYPGAVSTYAYGIDGDTIVGNYWDGFANHGFVYDGAKWTTLDNPLAEGTFVNGVSGSVMAGDYWGADGHLHGHLYNGSKWRPIDPPGAVQTWAWGIDGDKVVGYFWKGSGGDHGYLYHLADSTWTTLDFPGATQTHPYGIDGHRIVGDIEMSGSYHGFLYIKRAEGWVIATKPVGGYGVILHTSNGGHRWERQGSAQQIPNVGLNNVKAVDRRTAWSVGDADSGYGVILRTGDGGKTWRRQGNPSMIPDIAVLGVGAADRKTAWAVGAQGTILHTSDGGQTWKPQQSGTTANLYEVAVVSSDIAWIAGDTDNGYAVILHTANGGQSWERQGTAETLGAPAFIDMSAANAHTAWAVGVDGYTVKTTDGGVSWHVQQGPGLSHNNGVCAVNAKTAWIATDYNTVFRTTNRGKTWERLSPKLPLSYYLLGVSALDADTAWVAGSESPSLEHGTILHTADGGATWKIQPTPVNAPFRRISFVDAHK